VRVKKPAIQVLTYPSPSSPPTRGREIRLFTSFSIIIITNNVRCFGMFIFDEQRRITYISQILATAYLNDWLSSSTGVVL
jgi:hypothetical protein